MAKNEIVVIIPARGNSKSIPKKNIREFAGYPLIAYSITAALHASLVNRVIVSTDDAEIAAVAREYGAEVPFMRPDALAQDDTTDFPVFEHALMWLAENEDYHPDMVVHLRATSPVYPKTLIDDAIKVILDHPEADSVRGVVPSSENPYKMWRIGADGQMIPLLKLDGVSEPYNSPRQILPDTFWQTGHIDVIRTENILKKRSMNGKTIFPIYIDPAFSVDIDTPLDLRRAEQKVLDNRLDMIFPGKAPRPLPEDIRLLVLDFDGVMTDDRVYVNTEGMEMVAANRSDGFGLERLRAKTDIAVVVMSKETNPVVKARCQKLGLPVYQSVENKRQALEELVREKGLEPEQVMFVGNDLNDIPCFSYVGYAAVPRDAFPEALRNADLILQKAGGFGAVREVCEMLIDKFIKNH
jgi:YrbI family 3-deoxy-D-manno-octulosonate 8-phosphate phosphatase